MNMFGRFVLVRRLVKEEMKLGVKVIEVKRRYGMVRNFCSVILGLLICFNFRIRVLLIFENL